MAKSHYITFYDKMELFIDTMTDEQLGQLHKAMYKYSRYGEIPEFKEAILKSNWMLAHTSLDAGAKHYEKRALLSKAGGLTKKLKASGFKDNEIEELKKKYSGEYYSLIADRLLELPPYNKKRAKVDKKGVIQDMQRIYDEIIAEEDGGY